MRDTRRLSALFLLSSIAMLIFWSFVRGGPDDDARAAFALCQPPAANVCNCTGPANCLCGDDCQCVACAETKDADHYRDAYFSALNTRRQLVIWVGDSQCGPCRLKLKECVHCTLKRWDRDATGRVIVCRPVGQQLLIVKAFEGLPDMDEIKTALAAPLSVGGEVPAVCATCSH